MGRPRSSTRPPPLHEEPDADLIEPALCAAIGITPMAEILGRHARLMAKASSAAITLGAGKRCSPHRRCEDLSCLSCRWRAQLRFVATNARTLKRVLKKCPASRSSLLLDPSQLYALTLVPTFGQVSVGGGTLNLPSFGRKVRRLIECHAPDAVVLVCVDISWNDQSAFGEGSHWQLHVHGIIGNVSESARKRLARVLGGVGRAAHKPVRAEPLTDATGWLAYMAKPEFSLRVGYLNTNNGRRDSRPADLTLDQELTMMRWLSGIRADQRFFRIGDLEAAMARRAAAARRAPKS